MGEKYSSSKEEEGEGKREGEGKEEGERVAWNIWYFFLLVLSWFSFRFFLLEQNTIHRLHHTWQPSSHEIEIPSRLTITQLATTWKDLLNAVCESVANRAIVNTLTYY